MLMFAPEGTALLAAPEEVVGTEEGVAATAPACVGACKSGVCIDFYMWGVSQVHDSET